MVAFDDAALRPYALTVAATFVVCEVVFQVAHGAIVRRLASTLDVGARRTMALQVVSVCHACVVGTAATWALLGGVVTL